MHLRMMILLAALAVLAVWPSVALAAEEHAPAATTPAAAATPEETALALAVAYQSGYLQVVAISCFQLYSSTGIIHGDLIGGAISPAQALNALEHNSLLQSVCATTLEEVRGLTAPADTAGLAELDRLIAVNTAEGELLRALQDFCGNPDDTLYQAVLAAQQEVEQQLTVYTSSNQLGFKSAPEASPPAVKG